jgi:hypothetical protein
MGADPPAAGPIRSGGFEYRPQLSPPAMPAFSKPALRANLCSIQKQKNEFINDRFVSNFLRGGVILVSMS